ncbi:MAG: hypothetical protein IPK04_07885 [Bdellovibrionales bacterium]|nr:hypothetical protein [Bdellovibrionales bacterium]
MHINGIAVSPGFALGQVFLIEPEQTKLSPDQQSTNNPTGEILKLKTALSQACDEIQILVNQLNGSGRKDQAEIFEAHLLMVQDPEITDGAFQAIEEQKLTASAAYKLAADNAALMLSQLEDEYLSARAADVRDISQRVLQILSGKKAFDFTKIPSGAVIVGYDITPSQMAVIDPKSGRLRD